MLDEATRLEALDRLRTDFVSTISHDLRTPLTAARAALVLVDASAGDALRGDERDLLVNARRNVERLSLLIDDLLTSSQLQTEALQMERETIDLRTVVTDAMAAVHPLLQSRQQTVEVDLPRPLPCEGDTMKLEHAFLNLLANAHKHTPPGSHISVAGHDGPDGILVSVPTMAPVFRARSSRLSSSAITGAPPMNRARPGSGDRPFDCGASRRDTLGRKSA